MKQRAAALAVAVEVLFRARPAIRIGAGGKVAYGLPVGGFGIVPSEEAAP